jgi:outer membrane protein OmpA-like peptidoglycan-associated protein
MTPKLIYGLVLWAGALAFALLSMLALTTAMRIGAMVLVLIVLGFAWTWTKRRAARFRESLPFDNVNALPARNYRRPVILVCGDSPNGLFASTTTESMLRITNRGCYVRVPDVERLPDMVAGLLTVRPDWRRQLSVMFIVNPQAHADGAVLAGQVRALCHQLTLARRSSPMLPVVLVSYLQSQGSHGAWFSCEAGRLDIRVRVDGGVAGLEDWQCDAADSLEQQRRVFTTIQLRSLVSWLGECVLPHVTPQGRQRGQMPCAWAMTMVPAAGATASGNLWEQWLIDKTGLQDACEPTVSAGHPIPFPDPLLAVLPRHSGDTAIRRASVIAVWMFAAAGAIALINSAWQNTLLLREISDDLRRYSSVSALADRDTPQLVLLEESLLALRRDAQRLDDHYRRGEPLSLALGLYRGERLRAPLWEAITGYRAPEVEPVPERSAPVRLNSLSLFMPGRADFRAQASRVLIEALVDIKVRSGWLIVITGHTDATGGAAQNLSLSRARAEAVRDWMQRMGGIPDSCFAVQGLGASHPVASNETKQGRAANRRVDIRLVPEEGACLLPVAAPGRNPESQSATFEK